MPDAVRVAMNDKTLQDHYLRRILNSKVYDVAIESPLEKAATLSKKLGNTFLLKREDLQSVHSFKLRGAYNKMSQLPRAALEKGVLAASAGNHAQGVALSAKRLGCKATIVMPVTTWARPSCSRATRIPTRLPPRRVS